MLTTADSATIIEKVGQDQPAIDAYTKAEADSLISLYEDKIAELENQLETLEDRTAHFVYPNIPVIKFSVDSTLSAKVVRGNDSKIEILALNNETVAHNKTAANRYSGSVRNGDFQFNAIVEVPEGKAAYIECEKTDDTHPYSNVDTEEIDATHVRVKLTKVVEDLECSIKPAE